MMVKLVIFDFDGVLADSVNALYEINRLAASLFSIKLTRKDYLNLFEGNVHKKLHGFLKLNDKDLEEFLHYKYEIFDDYYNDRKVELFNFVPFLVKNLSKIADLCIVSSAPEDSITSLLEQNGLRENFFKISGINKEGKRHVFQKYINEELHKYSKIYFITDTSGDILEAKHLGIVTIAVGWGFHSREVLINSKPDLFVRDYKQLVDAIVS